MNIATLRTNSHIETIIFSVYKNNKKVISLYLKNEFKNKSLRECILTLKDLGELSEEYLIRIIEETHNYHLENYKQLQQEIHNFSETII